MFVRVGTFQVEPGALAALLQRYRTQCAPTVRATKGNVDCVVLEPAEEFQRRLAALRETGTIPDTRELHITRLKTENAALRERVQTRDEQITELTEFKERALSQLAAQHQEILRLRQTTNPADNVYNLPAIRKSRIAGPCS